jgi:predicted chitinase
LVQITWKANYENFVPIVGVDLVENPDGALSWKNAAVIMIEGMIQGMFTGKKLSDYIYESHVDYIGARKIINGTDKSRIFAEYATNFECLLAECA